MTVDQKIHEVLTRGVENIYPSREALQKVLRTPKKLRIYHGIDPTAPSLHLGHMVQMLKLRQFQELGHEIIVLIGDFTAQIGDPSDKLSARQPLTHKQVIENAKDYKKQIGRFLDLKKTIFKYNSKWLMKLSAADMLALASCFSAQQTLARNMFRERMAKGKDLFLHEFFYPVLQAYDSAAMDVDMEIGGSDQMFNMLAGRTLMKKTKNKEKFVLTTKLLTDPRGVKMGKTAGNMARLDDSAENMFGKVMSWPDEFILPGFELLTTAPTEKIDEIKGQLKKGKNPKELKMLLAQSITELNYGKKSAEKAREEFQRVHEKDLAPKDLKTVRVSSRNIVEVLVEAKIASSKSDARRVIEQGGVKVDGVVTRDIHAKLEKPSILQRGKLHFVKIIF